MREIERAAAEYLRANPDASTQKVAKHALAEYASEEEAKAFIFEVSNLRLKAAQFRSDVERIWPEEKGY